MKYLKMIILITLLGMTEVVAQEYEYVPFVREGVKWVYYYNNPFWRDVLDMDEGTQYYSFEMKGDVQIGDKQYKQVCLVHYFGEDYKETEDFVPVYLREENKVVYAIHPDGKSYPQCPIGIGQCVGSDFNESNILSTDEFILYDFNDPIALYDSLMAQSSTSIPFPFVQYMQTDTTKVGRYHVKRHHYKTDYADNDVIIEGIGYDSPLSGMPLFYFNQYNTGLEVDYFLSYVIENGEILYKGLHYNPSIHVSVDEVVADQRRPLDGNYYDLMGRAVGKDVPTTPGIYIHNGNKICVSRK